jgi:phosphoglycerate dehydrogenase-like enzyme
MQPKRDPRHRDARGVRCIGRSHEASFQARDRSCYGVGTDAIDLGYAKAHGIKITNTPDVLTTDVADMALGLLLSVARKIPQADQFVRTSCAA